jgi:hypothetical protein
MCLLGFKLVGRRIGEILSFIASIEINNISPILRRISPLILPNIVVHFTLYLLQLVYSILILLHFCLYLLNLHLNDLFALLLLLSVLFIL